MKDVAQLAQVGTKTVSRVINNEPNVSDAMAARVWSAVKALDYHVDMRAGSMRRPGGRTQTVGLLVSRVDNPFAGEVHRGVEDVARTHDVAVFSSSLDEDSGREATIVEEYLRRRVDGIIVDTTTQDAEYTESASRRGVPIIFIDRRPSTVVADTVSSDNLEAAALATRHLIDRGHRRIALLTERADIPTAAERRAGFEEAMRAAGISAEDTTIVSGLSDVQSADAAVESLLSGSRPPSAIFSAQNLITLGCLHALRRLGLQHTIALIGFDEIPLAGLLDPGLTVVRQDPRGIGRVAAEQLFRRLNDPTLPIEHQTVKTVLVPRGSGEIEHPDAHR